MLEESKNEVLQLLHSTLVSSLINRKFESPIIIHSKNSVADAVEILAQSDISSAPVVSGSDEAIHYMFEFRDICQLMVNYLSDESNGADSLDQRLTNVTRGSSYSFLIADGSIDQTHFKGKDSGFNSILLTDSVFLACTAFAKGQHRLAVVDLDGNFEGVISQSDVIKFLHRHQDLCSRSILLQQTLVDLNLAKKKTICIEWEKSVFDGMKLMVQENVSSIGLIDEAGLLVGVLSMSDAKFIFHLKAFDLLKSSLCDFVNQVRQVIAASDGKTRYPVFSVRPQATIEAVMQKLVATRAHRMYITENMEPVGVISLTDIIRTIIQ